MAGVTHPRRLDFPVSFGETPIIEFNVSHADALAILGPPTITDWIPGLGTGDFWGLEYSCGLQVVFEFLHQASGGFVVGDSPEIEHVLRHIPFERSVCSPIDDAQMARVVERLKRDFPHRARELESLHSFQVWRQDDNGNAFKVGEPTSERDARCLVQEFESHGHKQLYCYSRVT